MRRIVHISDLHFGRTDRDVVTALIRATRDLAPNLLVVSGDLTQRARAHQFEEARQFLDALDCPKIVVPGNHDVPLENLFGRFFRPFAKYRRYITEDLSPTYQDEELAVAGINTARSFTRASGSINDRQIERVRQFFCSVDPNLIKIVVTHHPLDIAENISDKHLLRRSGHAIEALSRCHADLYLAGHSHVPFAGSTERRYTIKHHSALIVQAGTSASTRTRSVPNSFNVIQVFRPDMTVEHVQWNASASRFAATSSSRFVHTADGWRTAGPDDSRFDRAV